MDIVLGIISLVIVIVLFLGAFAFGLWLIISGISLLLWFIDELHYSHSIISEILYVIVCILAVALIVAINVGVSYIELKLLIWALGVFGIKLVYSTKMLIAFIVIQFLISLIFKRK